MLLLFTSNVCPSCSGTEVPLTQHHHHHPAFQFAPISSQTAECKNRPASNPSGPHHALNSNSEAHSFFALPFVKAFAEWRPTKGLSKWRVRTSSYLHLFRGNLLCRDVLSSHDNTTLSGSSSTKLTQIPKWMYMFLLVLLKIIDIFFVVFDRARPVRPGLVSVDI